MKRMRWWLWVTIAALLAACAGGGSEQTTAGTPAAGGLNLLLQADGDVQLRRSGWEQYHPVGFGAVVNREDRLKLGNGASALVMCDSLATWSLPAGQESSLVNGCPPPPEPALDYQGSMIQATRGELCPRNVPCILFPRATKISDAQPELFWTGVPTATAYTVAILQGAHQLWSARTTDTHLLYPGQPPLEPGVSYRLVVTEEGGASSEDEKRKGLGFSLLEPAEVARLESDLARLAGQQLEVKAESYARALLYASRGLTGEAINTLETLNGLAPQEPAVYLRLGELYHKVGTLEPALAAYEHAVGLGDKAARLETRAEAHAGLGEILVALNRRQEAYTHLQIALQAYQELGDDLQVQRITEIIAALNVTPGP